MADRRAQRTVVVAAATAGAVVSAPQKRRRSGPKGSSPYTGVTQYKRTGTWEAHCWLQNPRGKGHQQHLGSFKTAEEAARCYDRALLKTRGQDADLNFPRSDYDEDAFMLEHARTEKFKFLDLLRTHFAIKSPGRPGQLRPKRTQAVLEDEEAPASPRTRTVVRAPLQRVTVHEHAIPVEPLHARHTAAPAAALMAAGGTGRQREQGQELGVVHASLHSPAGRGKGLVWLPSEAALEAEEGLLIPRTAPFTTSQDQLLLPGPPGGMLGTSFGPSSTGATPCSSPARFPLPAPLLRSPELPPPPKLRRTADEQEAPPATASSVAAFGIGGTPGSAAVPNLSLACPAFLLPPSLAGDGFPLNSTFGFSYPSLSLVQQMQSAQVQVAAQMQVAAAASGASAAGGAGAALATPASSAASLPLFAPASASPLTHLAGPSGSLPMLQLPSLQQFPGRLDPLLPDWLAPLTAHSAGPGVSLNPALPSPQE